MSRESQARNRAVWDDLAKSGSAFARVATDEECRQPLKTLDSRGWLPETVAGLDVLCLGAGGGWQSILYASAGAQVTVLDLSPEMLALDRREAAQRRLPLHVVERSMDDLSCFADGSFDLVHQPVSTCYLPQIAPMYAEISRVTRDNGLYISQHKQPAGMQLALRPEVPRYVFETEYYHTDPLPPSADTNYRESGADEYLHRWDQLVGELCRCGFWLEDLVEPRRTDPAAQPGEPGHRGRFVPPYVRLKARRRPRSQPVPTSGPRQMPSGLWLPSGSR